MSGRWVWGSLGLWVLAASAVSSGCGSDQFTQSPTDDGGATFESGTNADVAATTDGKSPAGCKTNADCGAGKQCQASACVAAPACNNSLDCPGGQVCDGATGTCVACVIDADCGDRGRCLSKTCRSTCLSDKDCTPQGQLCDLAAGHCVTCRTSVECTPEQYCSAGACLADVCTAGTSRCEANSVVGCNADGSKSLPPVACRSDQGCVVQGTTASCRDSVCPPMVAGCAVGEKAVLCAADGLSQTVVDDCGAKNQVCVAAACKPLVCQAGSLFCAGSELRRCSAKGDTSTFAQTCTSTQYCSDVDHLCKAQICSPSVMSCSNGVAVVCNATGSGYLPGGVNCTLAGKTCLQGACSDLVCTPNATLCSSGVAKTCNGTGTGYLPGGTDCAASGQACVQGACKPVVCTASSLFCSAETIRECTPDGTSSSLLETCSTSQYCDAVGPSCKTQICSPNQPACDANVATTCNTNGSAFTGVRTDCATQTCSNGQCSGCVRVLGSQWVRTRYATSTPWSVTMTDGAAQIPATGYGWVGWFEFDVVFPSTGNFQLKIRLADDGWHELKPDQLYNQIALLVDGTQRLAFNASTTAYDDGQLASGDLRFHNVTGPAFSATSGSHVLHFDNIADKWTGGDDLTVYFAYIDICNVP